MHETSGCMAERRVECVGPLPRPPPTPINPSPLSCNHGVELATSSAACTLTERDRLQANYSASVWKHREPSNREVTNKHVCFGVQRRIHPNSPFETVDRPSLIVFCLFLPYRKGVANKDSGKNMIKGQKSRRLPSLSQRGSAICAAQLNAPSPFGGGVGRSAEFSIWLPGLEPSLSWYQPSFT